MSERDTLRERLTADFASSFIRIRGAHNPRPGEPCAWCRLAAEQAAEAVVTNESIIPVILAATPAALNVERLARAGESIGLHMAADWWREFAAAYAKDGEGEMPVRMIPEAE